MVPEPREHRSVVEKRADAAIIAAIGYFLFATFAIELTSNGRDHATIWPADALILALLLKEPRRDWPWILFAGWAANLAANTVARGWTLGLLAYGGINMLQTGLAGLMLVHLLRKEAIFEDTRSVALFGIGAGVIAPLLGGLLGSAMTWLNYGEPFVDSLMRWYFSNALGLLILTPFLRSVLDGSYRRWLAACNMRRRLEIVGSYALHALVTALVFVQAHAPLLFVPVCSVVLLSFRIGRLGTKLGVMIVAIVGCAASLAGAGPIASIEFGQGAQAVFLQLYLGVLLVTTMPIAGIVSTRQSALSRLAEREEALRHLLLSAPGACLGFDASGVCNWAQGPTKAYLGLAPDAMLGRSAEAISLQVDALVRQMQSMGSTCEGVSRTIDFVPVRRPHLTLEGTIGVLWQAGRLAGAVVTLRDATERHARELALMSRAEADEHTGLLNASGFRAQLRAFLDDVSGPASLALVEVSGLDAIGERHGAEIGARVRHEAARRVSRAARDSDTVGHFGPDGFAILLPCDLLTARSVCERITDALRERALYSDGSVSVIASVTCGVAPLRADLDENGAMDLANQALEELKCSGRSGVSIAA